MVEDRDEQEGAAGTAEPEREDDDLAEASASDRLIAIVESVLFAAGEPLALARLGDIVAGASRAELRGALRALEARLVRDGRGIRLLEVAAGYQLRTAPEHAEWVRRLFQEKPWRLTRATLETLAIVAYKQPITRAEIEAIRGVDVDSVLASLLSRKLVRIVGRKDVIGRPILYGTTRQFLEVFGLRDLSGLPALGEVAPAIPDGVGAGSAAAGEESGSSDDDDTTGNTPAEAAGGSGRVLASDSGGDDPRGADPGERHGGDDARDPSGSD